MKKTQSTKTLSKKAKVLNALENGTKVTRLLAETRYKVVNLRATIADLRNKDGYNIETNYNKKNEVVYTLVK